MKIVVVFFYSMLFWGLNASHGFAKEAPISPAKMASYISKAQRHFADGNYNKAIAYYKKYLRKDRRNADVWNQMAVCFYYAGTPRKAIHYLRKWEKKSRLKSYNEFYSGLAYLTIGKLDKAKIYLSRAARFSDEYGSRAIYELAVIEYNSKNLVRTQYWVNLYRQRFPRGGFIKNITRMGQSMRNGAFINGLTGNKKPDIETALYKYSKYSIYKKHPHYWFMQIGYEFLSKSQLQPSSAKIAEQSEEIFRVPVYLGFGLGPTKTKNITSNIGYTYKHDWFSDQQRVEAYFEPGDPMDYFSYFPFRSDLLERTHQLYGEVEYKIDKNFYVGLFAQQEFRFIGAEYIPNPGGYEIEQNTAKLSESINLIPKVGANYMGVYNTELYLYIKKELSEQAPEESHKTYDYFGGAEQAYSFGLKQTVELPEYDLLLKGELFQLEYIYNDYFLDYTRRGTYVNLAYQYSPEFWVLGTVSYYEDEFKLQTLKQESCNKFGDFAEEASTPVKCTRRDTGTIFDVGFRWHYAKFSALSAKVSMLENKNAELKIHNKTQLIALVKLTMAFPAVDKVLRIVDKFGEEVFKPNTD